jgi:putative ABC transport system permease protein
LLCCIGLYGLLSQAVVRRTREFGVRQALGATRQDVVMLIMREMRLVALGVAAGLGISILVTRSVSSMLYGLSPNDPVAMISAVVILTTVASIAAFVPARRASLIDPMVSLRDE